jgi:putative peptidoglycan lipid II flippase
MSLLRNFATVGSGTAASRLLGFVRDILIAAAIGTGPVADAFFVALRLPNLFRRLFAEGAFASAFVPLFTRAHEGEGAEAGLKLAQESLAALAFALIVLTVAAELGMVWLTFVLAPGFAAEPEKFDLAVLLSRITFPYLFLVSIVSLLSGMLNGIGRFAAAALAPVLLNLSMIAALLWIWWSGEIGTTQAGIWLAASVTIAGVLQLAMLWIACRRAGLRIGLAWPRWTANVKRLTRLAGPSILAGGVVQINIVVGTIVASLQPGAVSWLYYADRLYQLPLGVVGIALAVILLPDLARSLAGGRRDLADHTQNRAIEFAAALTLPATVALLVIPGPIIAILFERGAFTAADTAATAPALAAYAVGLPAFVAIKVLQPAFFAREDTWTPMWTSAVSMIVNVVAAVVLFWLFGHVGIAAATTIAAWINTAQLAWILRRRGYLVSDHLLRMRLPLLALASVLMGVAVWALAWLMTPWLNASTLAGRLLSLAFLVAAGVALFVAICQAAGVVDFRILFRRRGQRAGGGL